MLQLLRSVIMTRREIGDASSAQREENDNANTPEITVTIQIFLDELEQSGRKLKKSSNGHRALLRDTLQTAQRSIVRLSKNETLRKEFIRALEKEAKNGRQKVDPSNWCLEVVAKATGASSRQARKLASKRAGVLEFLRERNVPVKKTATTIKKEGLEKLYSERVAGWSMICSFVNSQIGNKGPLGALPSTGGSVWKADCLSGIVSAVAVQFG
jgi:hypothetical protein